MRAVVRDPRRAPSTPDSLDPLPAMQLAEQSKAAGVGKLVWVAGASNVVLDDGVTPAWTLWAKRWAGAENAFKTHGACIDAIRASGVNYVIWCPAFMKAAGAKSAPAPTVRVNRVSGDFVSYEDAAAVMVSAAEVPDWDGQLITAATPAPGGEL